MNCAAYRDACLKYHPDKCGAVMMDEEAKEKCEERFKHIQEAFDVSPSSRPMSPHALAMLCSAVSISLLRSSPATLV